MKLSSLLSIVAIASFLVACGEKSELKEVQSEDSDSIITIKVESESGEDAEIEEKADSSTAVTTTDIEQLSPISTPETFTKLAEAVGNLDDDPTEEKIIVYDTEKQADMGTERQIHIYKADENGWKLWHKSIGAIMPSEHGGVMGDPFQGISIERGSIVIEHFGGSRHKWSFTHRFRNQDGGWKLIGVTVQNGAPCDYMEDFDYNLSTGDAIYKKREEKCDDNGENVRVINRVEESFKNKVKQLPIMDGFDQQSNSIEIPNGNGTMYY